MAATETPERILSGGLKELGLELEPTLQTRALELVALVAKWNRHYNLTAVREVNEMVSRHLLDSLALLRHLPSAKRLIDVGSGAGFPGIPLALARPESHITLLDSSRKRCRFLHQATAELKLTNTAVIETRVEQTTDIEPFEGVVCRAFAPLPRLLELAGHLCAPAGYIYALKGLVPEEELASLPGDFKLERVTVLQVPGLSASRHLIVLKKA
ncbi:MAG: 16S rRNA (guanine(527)-N(7))-methyltransferase RsmG [Gammaproteobacteria bacterium]|nr:16S rRNA (guanine(527)-N(7))-methyltransferase RsmG [Gammaproteobacteria bacterium]